MTSDMPDPDNLPVPAKFIAIPPLDPFARIRALARAAARIFSDPKPLPRPTLVTSPPPVPVRYPTLAEHTTEGDGTTTTYANVTPLPGSRFATAHELAMFSPPPTEHCTPTRPCEACRITIATRHPKDPT